MLQAATPASYFQSTASSSTSPEQQQQESPRRSSNRKITKTTMPDTDFHSDDEDFGGKHRNKSRRELPAGAVATLKAWLLSPEHFTHPYPTPQDQVMLMQKTGIDKKQLKNWFTNARRRIWKPMLKKQLEQGKLAAAGGALGVPGVVPGMMVAGMPGQLQPEQVQQYQQQPVQGVQEQQLQVDQYGNTLYQNQVAAPAPPQYYDPNTGAPTTLGSLAQMSQPAPAPSAAGLAPASASQPLSKTDSHAVLMELFARDQDLVRQATESAGKKAPEGQAPSAGLGMSTQPQLGGPPQSQSQTAQTVSSQHPMKTPSSGRLVNVPTLNSWPHFSSVSSLNNLGTMPGVKSITSLSAADLAKQGAVGSLGNLAQVKSVESMGKNDSYAFLEVFFGDRSSNNLSSMGSGGIKDQRGIKRERDEDNDVGLSLEDESPSTGHNTSVGSASAPAPSDLSSNPFSGNKGPASDSSDTLKRAYDDAMAARGLISVSRSSEKLTDLALPAKIQRTLSQELLNREQQSQPPQSFLQYSYTPAPAPAQAQTTSDQKAVSQSHQYPAQPSAQSDQGNFSSTDNDTSVQVPSATKCAICHQVNVDTQLRPCGHMFHEKCLKPSLQSSLGAPKCPIDHIPMQSALLAIPDENAKPRSAPAPSTQFGVQMQQGQTVTDSKA